MTSVRLHRSLTHLRPEDWQTLSGTGHVDRGHAYLGFREYVEPGEPVVAIVDDGKGICAAMHGALSCARTGLFSHPWKMLTSPQFLRTDAPASSPVRAQHIDLIEAIAGLRGDAAPAEALTKALGEALVVRGFDNSEVIFREDLDARQRSSAAAKLVESLQSHVNEGLAGAIVLPFVEPQDDILKAVLARHGFRQAVLTATTFFDLSAVDSYEAFLASLRTRMRSRFRNEERAMADSGLLMSTVALRDTLERVTELEALNAEKYGAAPDRERLRELRRFMADRLGSAVRVPAVTRDDGTIVACGLHLVDDHTYCNLVYGCDYGVEDRGTAYQCVNFYDPLRYAIAHKIRRLRLGFEAFSAKLLRGAQLSTRETWLWVPDPKQRAALDVLLRFLDGHAARHFDDLTPKR